MRPQVTWVIYGPSPLPSQNTAAGGGGRPLGGRRALVAVEHRHPVLPLRRAEMGAGDGGSQPSKAAVNEQRRQGQALPHGGAGAVQPVKRNFEIPQTEGRADALVQQIPRQHIIQILRPQTALFHGLLQGKLLHGGLSLLPAFLPEVGVLIQLVEIGGQGSSGLLLAPNVGKGHHAHRLLQAHGLPSQSF